MELSILCVTTGQHRARPFLEDLHRLGYDLDAEVVILHDGTDIQSAGNIESCLDEAVARTKGDYILRIDDDERCSAAMERWLLQRNYLDDDHWTFPRMHFWGDTDTVIMDPYYYPDYQTRLSVRAKAGGRPKVHDPSPFGAGSFAKVHLEHWCFLVKDHAERCRIAMSYGAPAPGHSFEEEHPGAVDFADKSLRHRWTGTIKNWRRIDGPDTGSR